MKLTIKTIAFTVAIAALCMPTIDARGRNNGGQNNQHTEKHKDNPSHSNNHNRPNNGNHNRPNPGNHNQRPGNNPRPDSKPGNQRPPQHNNAGPSNRPGNNHHAGQAPTPSRPPQHNAGPAPRPGNNHHHVGHTPPPPRPPQRPLMPAHRPWQRPTPPPPTYRPAPGWTPFQTILGVTLGSAINISINALMNSGYNVTGYGNDAVYVANASMLNMLWPDATLFYNNGGLYASEFVYSTPVYNMSRYNSTYRALVRNYGNPVSSTNNGGSLTTTWWGPNGQFINLTFQNALSGDGSTRFYTTLSFGN